MLVITVINGLRSSVPMPLLLKKLDWIQNCIATGKRFRDTVLASGGSSTRWRYLSHSGVVSLVPSLAQAQLAATVS